MRETLNVELVSERLFKERAAIGKKYGIDGDFDTSAAFIDALVDALDQPPLDTPMTAQWSPSEVYKAAVRALGSSQTGWSKYMDRQDRLEARLHGLDPIAVAQEAAHDRELLARELAAILPGAYRRDTSLRIILWAELLTERPDLYSEVQKLATAISGIANLDDQRKLLPLLATAVAGQPPKSAY